MRKLSFLEIRDLKNLPISHPIKWGNILNGSICANVAELDFTLSDDAHKMFASEIKLISTGYGAPEGNPSYREAVTKQQNKLNRKIQNDWVAAIPSVRTAINLAARALFGDLPKIILTIGEPVYDVALNILNQNDRIYSINFNQPLPEQYELTKNGVIYINSPMNPTGLEINQPDFDRAMAFAKENDYWVFFNGIYEPLGSNILTFDFSYEKFVYFFSFSKCYPASGMRIGYMINNGELLDLVSAYYHESIFKTSELSQKYAEFLCHNDDEILPYIIDLLKTNRAILSRTFANLNSGFKYIKPTGGYTAIIESDLISENKTINVLAKNGVRLFDSRRYLKNKNFVRISYGTSPEIVYRASHIIVETLNRLS